MNNLVVLAVLAASIGILLGCAIGIMSLITNRRPLPPLHGYVLPPSDPLPRRAALAARRHYERKEP
jgi:hypothetical protein